jgi:hypothetical protein
MSHQLEDLQEINPDALTADGFDDAIIGYTVSTPHPHVVVYDVDKCVEILVDRDGMTPEEADEYLSFNTLCCYVGENTPLFVKVVR